MHREAIEALKTFASGSNLTQHIQANPNGFFNGGNQPTYADVAIASHLNTMRIFWKHFLNLDLFDANEGADIQAVHQLFNNIY